PIYTVFPYRIFDSKILSKLPSFVENNAININGLLSLICESDVKHIKDFKDWIGQTLQLLSPSELYSLSLYTWLCMESQVPLPPFQFSNGINNFVQNNESINNETSNNTSLSNNKPSTNNINNKLNNINNFTNKSNNNQIQQSKNLNNKQ